ncbi:type I-E CRISPR-associated protein Cas7/Cse4/CasC [Haloechinothrix sp. YIM 98757]|uniref:Type I-E CRISPR-associated protein Cas7/Cse4/CasC n=1 Tax=Haloechinothrix aidingensis TaxID=2752311 RepID=A0A838ADH1_9PSEU|nr:type I-E CRISPR-associated protein Cas7/Cse4/CasC [Haloechinothrix aidingensis]MBA0127237.1 type I-E CRISPR-associated protein Cas7/Cse4/CasC [Haloechinothrix aidingensis]
MSSASYINIHAIQSLPYSNVNRDDLGSPKTVYFGGVERTRVSSQSWKRVIRKQVEQQLVDEHLGEETVRTRRVAVGVAERLEQQGWSNEDAQAAGEQVALSAGGGISLKNDKNDQDEQVLTTNVLLFLPESGIDELARIAADHREAILNAKPRGKRATPKPVLPSDEIATVLTRRSPSINLFGRMLAELPGANVDGAVQVAHAFTTHGTRVEYDFFSAVDDVEEKLDIPGSGHINTGMFSAGTFYRYANIDVSGLLHNLDGDTALAATVTRSFLDAFIRTLPSGKQNATAAMTVPELVHISVRDDRPVSLASAFEEPLSQNGGYIRTSLTALASYAGSVDTLLGREHVLASGYAGNQHWNGVEGDDLDEKLAALGARHDLFTTLVSETVDAAYAGERT